MMLRQLPNILTIVRFCSAPVLLCLFLTDITGAWRDTVATVLFLSAMSTDFLDGFFARRLKVDSRFGKFSDPIADKFLIITCLLLLLAESRAHILAVVVIILREFYMTSLREWMALTGKSVRVGVSGWGKWKTGVQTAAVAMLFYYDDLWSLPMATVGTVLLWAAVALSVVSMVFYTLSAFRGEAK